MYQVIWNFLYLSHSFPLQVQGNAALQASLERQKTALRERRLALEQDVSFIGENIFSGFSNSSFSLLYFPCLSHIELLIFCTGKEVLNASLSIESNAY